MWGKEEKRDSVVLFVDGTGDRWQRFHYFFHVFVFAVVVVVVKIDFDVVVR